MKKIMPVLLIVMLGLLIIPLVSYAKTKAECESYCIEACGRVGGTDFNGCVRACMIQCWKENKNSESIQEVKAQEYNCLCTKCNHNWVSVGKPTKCPNCGNEGIIYTEKTSENITTDKEEQLAQFPEPNCVCAECGKKCGTGHETWCSSYRKPKAKPEPSQGLAESKNSVNNEELMACKDLGAYCIEKGLICILNGTPCCAPYECKGKFPNTYCQ